MAFGNGQKKPFEHKLNSGNLFRNEKKQKDTDPDFTGNGNIKGEFCWFSMWNNPPKDGRKGRFAIKFNFPEERDQRQPGDERVVPRRGDDKDIPW